MSEPAQGIFWPHRAYQWLALLCLLILALLLRMLFARSDLETLFFCTIMLLAALWFGYNAFCRVEINATTLILHKPIGASAVVTFQQLVSATESGRLITALTLLYHPRQPDGLLDLDSAQSLNIPAVQNQEQLHETILAKIP
ncbi:MAG: hypothetical protein R3C14_28490 [Caldilineaceae bacterium]